MSAEKLAQEATRWFEQAVDDLRGAGVLRATGHHALACFHAQQAGEKALKAYWRLLDLDAVRSPCAGDFLVFRAKPGLTRSVRGGRR